MAAAMTRAQAKFRGEGLASKADAFNISNYPVSTTSLTGPSFGQVTSTLGANETLNKTAIHRRFE